MKEKQFEEEIGKIQNFLNMNDWEFSFKFEESPGFLGELTEVDYKRFNASFTFDKRILTEKDEYISKIIMHEVSHIFTIMNLRQFSMDILNEQMTVRLERIMDILNEQMTVRLERILSKFYK